MRNIIISKNKHISLIYKKQLLHITVLFIEFPRLDDVCGMICSPVVSFLYYIVPVEICGEVCGTF